MFKDIDSTAFIKGAAVSILFGLLGTIPWILVRSFTGFFVGWLGFLIAFAAFKGFEIGAGKAHKSALFVVIPVVLFAVPFSEIVSTIIEVYKLGYTLSPYVISILASDGSFWGGMIINILIGYVIAVFGTFSIIRNVLSA